MLPSASPEFFTFSDISCATQITPDILLKNSLTYLPKTENSSFPASSALTVRFPFVILESVSRNLVTLLFILYPIYAVLSTIIAALTRSISKIITNRLLFVDSLFSSIISRTSSVYFVSWLESLMFSAFNESTSLSFSDILLNTESFAFTFSNIPFFKASSLT